MAANSKAALLRQEEAEEQPSSAKPALSADSVDLRHTPGHLLRRAQQRAVEIYQEEVGEDGLRPPQYALLLTIYQNAGLNQTELVQQTGIDRSTLADMIARLEKRGLLLRKPGADQRSRQLWITDAGATAVKANALAGQRAQERIMAPIAPDERTKFLEILGRIADLPQS
jgi:DNA-binding MarR family transcriptional regulator